MEKEKIDPLAEPVAISLPRGAWNVVVQHLWKYATCEVGNPLIEAIRSQLEPKVVPIRPEVAKGD